MPTILTVTNAGRAALINAQNIGTAPMTITQFGISETAVVPAVTDTALAGEVKRVSTLSGDIVDDDTIHLIVRDESTDAFALRSCALYLNDGTLFAIYGQVAPILSKTAQSMMMLAMDVRFADIDVTALTFGDANFLNPPATTEALGVVELATSAEGQTGTDLQRAMTPKAVKDAVTAWLDARFGINNALVWNPDNDGSGSGLDGDYLRGQTPDQGVSKARVLAALGFVPVRGNGFIGDADLNTIITSGVYRFQHPLNGPAGVAWGQLLVLRGGSSIPGDSSDTIAQIVMDDTQSILWCRSGPPAIVGGGGAWGPWREMVDSARLGAASFGINGTSMRRNGYHLYGPDNDGSGSGIDGDYLRGQTPDQVVSNARVLAALGFTPLGLSNFTGANQSLGASGYQKLPGGMLLQWGTITLGDGAYGTWTFPTTFPTACLHVGGGIATEVGNSDAQANGPLPYGTATTTSCPFYCAACGGPYTAWTWTLGH